MAASAAWGQSVNITSAPNIVGSGARALGMGGAFIAVADDATAASWNPGGLTQLERPEFSLVYDFHWNSENFRSAVHPELNGGQDAAFNGINYMSGVWPVPWTLGGRNFVLSLNYQRNYDFDRNMRLNYRLIGLSPLGITGQFSNINYRQRGQLGAISPAFGFEITDELSVGMVANFYHHALLPDNEWTITAEQRGRTQYDGVDQFIPGLNFRMQEKYRNFQGVNFTFGTLYKPNDRLSLGMVYHTRLNADVEYTRTWRATGLTTDRRSQEITFPDAIGVGAAYRFADDKLTLSLDVTRRDWNDFVIHDPHNRQSAFQATSGVTSLPLKDNSINATWTVRMGAEYVFVNSAKPKQDYLPSVRAGVFYDPEPASHRPSTLLGLGRGGGKPDDFYGISLGAGVLIKNRVNIDLAYVYRWGNHVRQDTFGMYGTSADVGQHMLYLSTVVYF
jgi:long-subunit fatty acid transport protein